MSNRAHSQLGWTYLAIALLASFSTGCRSGQFSMPGKSLFSWSRQPDATTLAGTQVPELPQSPAAKYDPTAIASMNSKSPSTSPAPGSAYGYSPSPANSPTTGLAATANGYQTGPYQVAPKTNEGTAGSSPASAMAANSAAGTSLPNPYGGTYSGATTSTTTASTRSGDIPLPTSVAAALSNGAAAVPAYPSMGSGLPAYPTNAMPVGYASNTAATPASQSSYQTAVPEPAVPSIAMPSSTAGPALPVFPNFPSASAGTPASMSPSATQPTNSAYVGSTTLDTFSPGSTGRKTSYDFSGNSSGSGSSSTSLPPNTATGTIPLLR